MLPPICDSKLATVFHPITANIHHSGGVRHIKHGSRHRGFGLDPEFQPTRRGSIRAEIPPFSSPSSTAKCLFGPGPCQQ